MRAQKGRLQAGTAQSGSKRLGWGLWAVNLLSLNGFTMVEVSGNAFYLFWKTV